MDTQPRKTMEDLEFNEILFVSRSGAQLRSWRGWKRDIAAFHDPKMWEDPAHWASYFELLDGNAWGPVGKGVVLMDFDARQTLTLSDWSTPDSLMPHNPHTIWKDGEDPAIGPLRALGARSDQWNRVEIEFTPIGILGGAGESKNLAVGQLLPAGAGADDFLRLMTLGRDGMLDLGKHGRGHAWCRYAPEGWVSHDDRGKEMPEWLIERLEELLEHGWPAPHWESMDSHMQSSELPLDAGQIQEMLDEDGDDDWVREITGLGKRYLALKQRWAAATPAAGPKP